MLFMPLTGYWFSAEGGYSLPFFWLFQWPRLLTVDKAATRTPELLHGYGALRDLHCRRAAYRGGRLAS